MMPAHRRLKLTEGIVQAGQMNDALNDWREAERRWEATDSAGPDYRSSAIAVISAWLRYQELADGDTGSFVMVADDQHRYVAVSDGVETALGFEAADLLGRRIEDIAAPDLAPGTLEAWQRFLADGRQDGVFRLVASDGREVAMSFQARAHHPIAGFHTSRLRPIEADVVTGQSSAVASGRPVESLSLA
jgi:PAS domain S-box-containing protein